jgi:hypothetical protein
MARMRHSKIADGRPLSGEERSCSGHHRNDRVLPPTETSAANFAVGSASCLEARHSLNRRRRRPLMIAKSAERSWQQPAGSFRDSGPAWCIGARSSAAAGAGMKTGWRACVRSSRRAKGALNANTPRHQRSHRSRSDPAQQHRRSSSSGTRRRHEQPFRQVGKLLSAPVRGPILSATMVFDIKQRQFPGLLEWRDGSLAVRPRVHYALWRHQA